MKRTLTATAVFVAAVTPAAAQQARWSGPYIGAHAGFGSGDTKFSCIGDTSDCSPTDGKFRIEGALIGGQIGYNWTLKNGLVTGIEADLSFTDIEGDAFFGGKNQASSLNTMGTVRGRAGTHLTPDMIAFATAGLAFGSFKDRALIAIDTNESTKTSVGWTAGFGFEKAISDRISLKAEYLYMDFGTASHSFTDSFAGTGTMKFDHDLHTFRIGLNFRLP